MKSFGELLGKVVGLVMAVMVVCCVTGFGQQSSGTLRGRVMDELGGLIVGATVTVSDASGVERTATTDNEGNYVFSSLAPGRYTLRVNAPGFTVFENPAVEVTAGRTEPLNVTLSVTVEQAEVTVTAESPVSTEPENNAGAVVLRGTDLEALPDDPDDLADALQALAGPSAGQSGGEIFIDGFSGGRLPPKESIREIRINRNPFSAEYDRLGYGRIEIFTKPGTDRFRGQGFFSFNDESLNSRNPFAPNRAPFQSRRFGGNLSGPISAKRASFFLDFERRETDDNQVINAVILDPALNITPFSQVVLSPVRRTTFSPRLDYQLNANNTLVARYSFSRASDINAGVGDFNLLSRAYNTSSTQHTVQLTETAIINQKIINETRLQYVQQRQSQIGTTSQPTIRVLEAFTGGGAQVGQSFNDQDRVELQNYTSWSVGQHSLKAGARARFIRIRDISPQNFTGTFTFAGGAGLTSIQRFQLTERLLRDNVSPEQIRRMGGGATQFTISGGNPEAVVKQLDFSPFIQDDWRLRPNLTLSLGLRYETQNNIHDRTNFAPRLAFAWSPGAGGAGRQQKTVIRGGFGLFYERFAETLSLQANRFNGTNQQQFVVTTATPGGAELLNLYPVAPTIQQLSAFAVGQTIRQIAPDLRAPYTMQTAISIERQLPLRISLSASFINARTLHVLRVRNINAPIPATFVPGVGGSGLRPFGNIGNIYEYESSGRFNQNQLIVSANSRFSRNLTLFANYVFNKANSDTDGPNTFPANQYDLSGEYGRSSVDVRHRFFLGGSVSAPWGIRLNPFIIANTGRPFNITIGRDLNGDTLFTERPAFAGSDVNCADTQNFACTRFGNFKLNPQPGDQIIPRNFGEGPSFFNVNLRISKTFGFGEERTTNGPAGGGRGGRGGGGGRGGRGGGFGMGGGGDFGGDAGATAKRYNLTLSLNIQNLLNHTNLGTPVGNLSSPLFGQSITTAGGFGSGGGNLSAGNRRIEALVRFSF